jgi:chorismate mutase / prephenate dehydratase
MAQPRDHVDRSPLPARAIPAALGIRPTATDDSPVSVVYPGREGAHSAAACEALFPTGAEITPAPGFRAVAGAVTRGDADFGVLPIENSLVGPVPETHDLLFELLLSVVAETILPVDHQLVGLRPIENEAIRVVHSHPVALDQCRRLLDTLPQATAVAAPTTADAARHVAETGDPTHVAIASERAARLHGLAVLAENVGDHPEAYTRFVTISTYTRLDSHRGPFRTALSFVTDHRAGALNHAIEPFARFGIDLVQLVSRPIPQTPWRYRFDAVLTGHPLDDAVRGALAEVRSRTRLLRVLGSYPAAS